MYDKFEIHRLASDIVRVWERSKRAKTDQRASADSAEAAVGTDRFKADRQCSSLEKAKIQMDRLIGNIEEMRVILKVLGGKLRLPDQLRKTR